MKNILLGMLAAVPVGLFILWLAFALSTRIVFGFRLRAILGFERQCKRQGIMYVSRAHRLPTPVFWLGSEDWQEELVARGIATGALHPNTDTVDRETNWQHIVRRVPVWPSVEAKKLYGKPEDVAPNESSEVLSAEILC